MTSREPPSRAPLLLCVDDDPLFLRSLGRTLGRRGYRIVPCESADQALKSLRRARPDLAIVDVMMPGMDGLELMDTLTQRNRVPVILLSALTTDEVCYEGHRRGAAFCLTKPCEPDRLLDAVDYLVGDLTEEDRRILKERL